VRNNISKSTAGDSLKSRSWLDIWLPVIAWGLVGIMLILLAVVLIWKPDVLKADDSSSQALATLSSSNANVNLADFNTDQGVAAILRFPNPHTIIPTRTTEDIRQYTVLAGDALFGIAKDFNIKPETLLWANYSTLQDNPDTLSIGQNLNVPPVDGVYYQMKDGDTLQGIADRFGVTVYDIVSWPGNHLDLTNPQVESGTYIMAPGGHREYQSWVVSVPYRKAAGVIKNIMGPNGCDISGGAVGGGGFVWPADNHFLSGNDFWSGHLGIDIAAGMGARVYASDTGVVVYAGAIGGGYGNMVMIDHGNGYQTLYAHLSQINVRCGANVSRGQTIALAGSTGNSTGAHLHFELRYFGSFVNPWNVLP
jgi:murein DD-endopeptidase MepM/ murein hydrolase activator NlpD